MKHDDDPVIGIALFTGLGIALIDVGLVQKETDSWFMAIGSGMIAWVISVWLLCELADKYFPRG